MAHYPDDLQLFSDGQKLSEPLPHYTVTEVIGEAAPTMGQYEVATAWPEDDLTPTTLSMDDGGEIVPPTPSSPMDAGTDCVASAETVPCIHRPLTLPAAPPSSVPAALRNDPAVASSAPATVPGARAASGGMLPATDVLWQTLRTMTDHVKFVKFGDEAAAETTNNIDAAADDEAIVFVHGIVSVEQVVEEASRAAKAAANVRKRDFSSTWGSFAKNLGARKSVKVTKPFKLGRSAKEPGTSLYLKRVLNLEHKYALWFPRDRS